ncbi:cadherin domain-containing protein, partial [Novipirellula herctigrandis]
NALTGAFVDTFVSAGDAGLSGAEGLAFGSDGNLYVADYDGDRVMRFDGTTGAYIDDFVTASSGGLNTPYAITFGPDGNLYVNSYTENNVLRYNGSTGAFIDTFVVADSGGLSSPEQMRFGPDGNLYISSYDTDEVLRYDGTTGAFMDAFVSAGLGGLDKPTGFAFGPDGNLYVADYQDAAILRFDGSSGAFIDEYVVAGTGGLTTPTYISFLSQQQVKVVAPPNGGQFWFSTTGAGSTSSLPSWDKAGVIELGGTNLSFDTAGAPVDTTSGEFTPVFDVENFDSGSDVNALHYVGRDITIGGNSFPAFDLFEGDVLVSTKGDADLTSTNSLSVKKEDLFVFRPDAPGNYSSGTFHLLLENPAGAEIRGITLVEQTTTLPDTTLAAGTFLYVRSGEDKKLFSFVADDVGVGNTSGTSQVLIDGADIGIGDKFFGVELIERPMTVAGTALTEGQILLTIDSDGDVGSNALTSDRQDVFILDVTQTTLGSGTTMANATLLIDGSDIELDDNNESLDAIALFNQNIPPTDISISDSDVDENTNTASGFSVGTLTATDTDAGETFTWQVIGGSDIGNFSIGGSSSDELTLTDGLLNFESQSSYEVIVRVTDAGGNQFDKTLYVTVNDLNEAPTVTLSSVVNNLSEDTDTSSAIVVATIAVSDDALGTETLTLTGNDASLFEIVGNDLRLRAGSTLNFETNPSLDVTVNVDDASIPGSPDDFDSHSVTISDVNEAPTITLSSVVSNLDEDANTSSAIVVATIAVSDDALGTETLTLTGTDAAMFEIVGNNLRLRAGSTLNFETNPSLDVTVNVDDAAIPGNPEDFD